MGLYHSYIDNSFNNTPRFSGMFGLGRTKSFRLGSGMLFGEFGGNCITGDSEIFVQDKGWVRLDSLTPGVLVNALCWNKETDSLSYQTSSVFAKEYAGTLHARYGWYHKHKYTSDHLLACVDRRTRKVYDCIASYGLHKTNGVELKVSSALAGNVDLTDEQASLVAMLQADGSYESGTWRITFMKPHKKARIKVIEEAGACKLHRQTGSPGYDRYAVYPTFDVNKYLCPKTKTFNLFALLTLTVQARWHFLGELGDWDGVQRNKSTRYFNTNRANCEIVQTLAHLSGMSANISTQEDNNRGYGQGNNLPLHTVNIKPRDFINLQTCTPDEEHFNGTVWCLTTPTGYFITRRHGSIVITHNCQNSPKVQLTTLQARPGKVFVQADQSGAEALAVANLARPGRYRELFAANIKPHTFLALHIFGRNKPQWFSGLPKPIEAYITELSPLVLKELPGWKELNERIKDSDDTEPDRPYYSGKRTAHARSYKMGWKTFQQAVLKDTGGLLVLTPADAKRFLATFDELFPEIIEWQHEVVAEAKATGMLRNLFGFPRECAGLFTHSYERDLISWKPQSTIACITHEGVLYLNRFTREHKLDWTLLNQKHDSLLLEVPEAEAEKACEEASRSMSITLVGRDNTQFTMKSETQVGKNWGRYHATKNPDGMRTVK